MARFIIAGRMIGARVELAAQLATEPMREPDYWPSGWRCCRPKRPVEPIAPDAGRAGSALLRFCYRSARPTGFIESRARTAAGVLLLARKKQIPSPDNCAIGIDFFGTVNTSVYQRFGAGGKPEPIMLKNHLILPFAADFGGEAEHPVSIFCR